MKTLFSFKAIIAFAVCCFTVLNLNAQFEESIGSNLRMEDAWDGKQLGVDHFVMLANTNAFSPNNQILLTETDAAGNVVNFITIGDGAQPNDGYYGRALDIDYIPGSVTPNGFFITGYRKSAAGQQMIVIRTNLNGFPTWTAIMPNVVNTVTKYFDAGVSIERQPNGDVVAIGKFTDLTITAPTDGMIAARFNPAGGLLWSFRYNPPTTGVSIVPAESCNALRGTTNQQTVVVVGRYMDGPNFVHTFASCLDANTGLEIWRRHYNSGSNLDEGFDVVQYPTNKRLMIVGREQNAAGSNNLWVIGASVAAGAFISGSVYSMPNAEFVGRDVCLSTANNRAVIAGAMRGTTTTGTGFNRAFMMRIPFTNNPNPDWTRYYEASSPLGFASESIVPVVAGGAAIAGYLMVTNAQPNAWVNNGLHGIYTDINGFQGLADCPVFTLGLAKVAVGTNFTMAKPKIPFGWNFINPQAFPRNFVVAACDGVMPAPKGIGLEDRTEAISFNDAVVAPNPVLSGDDLNVRFNLEQESDLSVQMFDVTGKLLQSETYNLTAGEQTLAIPTVGLQKGAYVLRLQTENNSKTVRVMVQ